MNFNGTQTTTTGTTVTDQPTSLDIAQRSKGVVDMGAGAELYMSDRISLLLGLSTDVTALPAGTLQSKLFNYFEDRTDRIAMSAGVGTHGTGSELEVGAQFTYGWGDRLSVNSYQLPPVIGTAEDHQYQLMVIVAGSTSLRALKRVVDDVKRVVTDPTPQKPVLTPKPEKPLKNPLD